MSLDSMQACSSTNEDFIEAREWSQLPLPALTNLMLKAGQSARHGSLALVCRSWEEAVIAVAAEEIIVYRCCRAKTGSLQYWLDKHGKQLQKVRLRSVKGLSVLPCPQLQHLWLHSCDLQLGSGLGTSISKATALTSLHMNKCRLHFQDPGDVEITVAHLMLVMASLTALQELSLYGVAACSRQPGWLATSELSAPLLMPVTNGSICSGSSISPSYLPLITVLQPLQHLTQLHLQAQYKGADSCRGFDRLVQHTGSMTNLQDLRLGGVKGDPLQLVVTQLTALTKLQRLGLCGVVLDAGTLTESGANVAALLAWLPRLQGLSSLQLRDVNGLCAWRPGQNNLYPSSTAYSSLTASSALQHIDLRGAELTQDAWQHAFPRDDWSPDSTRDGKFTNITSLRFGPHLNANFRPVGAFLYSVAGSCPNLQDLQACDFEDVGPFKQHTSLTRLTFKKKSAEWSWEFFVWQLGQLTQLKSLQLLGVGSCLFPRALYELSMETTLAHLSFLGIGGCVSGHDLRHMRRALDSMAASADLRCMDDDNTIGTYTFFSKSPPGSPSDLASQLKAVLHRTAKLQAGA